MNNPAENANGAKVLVVDDMQINLELTSFMLSPYGVQVDMRESGIEAVEAVKTSRYDLIFMDHMMPEMDGIEAVKLIRESGGHNSHVPIIALSGAYDLEEKFLQNGFNGFLPKPIDPDTLDAVVVKWIPKEKLSSSAESAVSADSKEHINIDGIDTALGLSRMAGSIENYLRTLTIFYKDGTRKIDEIGQCLKTDNLHLYTIHVHALKGAAANIGAMDLSGAAKALEEAGNKKDRAFIDAHTPRLLTDLEVQLKGIDEFLAMERERWNQSGGTDSEALKAALNSLISAIDEFCPAAINTAAKELRPYEHASEIGDKIESILQNVLIGEYDEVLVLIDSIGSFL
ncbi:MAG: response regulator [Chitinispirillales bacterium]|jgi:CheY-like chemotaxis protein|nr:response regulator [Chitinispirillales bacterium]